MKNDDFILKEFFNDAFNLKSHLIEFLKTQDSNSQFTCWGGHYMQNAGGNLVVDLSSLSFMGFWEVLKNINEKY